MNSSALFVITTDPRISGRPAEAVRIAAGVGVWKKVEVALYLRGAAALLLGEDTADLIDEENYTRYLPELARLGHASLPFAEITDAQLADLAASRNCLLRF
jgi:hypothetical protein